jgi:hypothetical protein
MKRRGVRRTPEISGEAPFGALVGFISLLCSKSLTSRS